MSQQSVPVLTLPIVATGTCTKRRFVTAAGAQAGAAANALGVTQEDAVSGGVMPVDVLGTTVVEAGAAFAAGAALETDSSGRGVTKASGPAVARALQAASQAGDLVEVNLIPN